MANLAYDGIEEFTPAQQRFIRRFVDSHNSVAQQVNANPVGGQTPAPLPHSKLQVTAGNGNFKVEITPSGDNFRGHEHFVEASESPDFSSPMLFHLGAATSAMLPLGERTLHFRSYCQHDTSEPSEPTYCKNVSGAGGYTPTVSSRQPGMTGYGATPYAGPMPPKRRSA